MSMTHDEIAELGDNAAAVLRGLIERIERLEEEKKAIAEDIKNVYGEAKSQGFDVKVLRKLVQMRRVDDMEREEIEQLTALYKAALGMN
jgi:uncharacterized protein (UPF0335 family)